MGRGVRTVAGWVSLCAPLCHRRREFFMLGFVGCGWVRIGCKDATGGTGPMDARRCTREFCARVVGWPQSVASLAIAASIMIGVPQHTSVASAAAIGVPVQSPAMDPMISRAMEDLDFKLNKSLFEEA